jgi:hypothetical protein
MKMNRRLLGRKELMECANERGTENVRSFTRDGDKGDKETVKAAGDRELHVGRPKVGGTNRSVAPRAPAGSEAAAAP